MMKSVKQSRRQRFAGHFQVLLLILVIRCMLTESVGLFDWTRRALDVGSSAFEVIDKNLLSRALPEEVVQSPSEESSTSGDYDAMCLLPRKPALREPATLFFFSSFAKGKIVGCKSRVSFDLAPSRVAELGEENSTESQESDADDLDEQEEQIKLLKQKDNMKTILIKSESYNGNLSTYVLVHGFLADWKSDPWMCELKDLILNNSKANVFILDWSGGSKPLLPIDYGMAVANTKHVAGMLAAFIVQLIELSGSSASRFHLIGHSLGAHICGFTGYSVKSATGTRLGKITALDPAGPCFNSNFLDPNAQSSASTSGFLGYGPTKRRLSGSSAHLVKAIHTDTLLFGLNENCAHYDVYVNSGMEQPGCSLIDKGLTLHSCAHSYSHDIIDSVLLPSAIATPSGSKKADISPSSVCSPMAFRCSSWEDYKLGKCGFCPNDDDGQCFYLGLDLRDIRQGIKQGGRMGRELSSVNSSEFIKDVQHFTKTGPEKPHCLFQYQIVVSTFKKKQVNELEDEIENDMLAGDVKFYLELPLAGNEKRLIEVSNKIDANESSKVYAQLHTILPEIMRPHVNPSEAHHLINKRSTNSTSHQYYTALLSFDSSAQSKGCSSAGSLSNENHWTLCKPLPALKGAKIYSLKADKLATIKWVALNYMSGARVSDRLANSQILVPKQQGSPLDSNNMNNSNQIKLLGLVTGLATSALQPIDCLLSEPECSAISHQLTQSLELRTISSE